MFTGKFNQHPSFRFGVAKPPGFGRVGVIPFDPNVPIGKIGYPNPNAVAKNMSKLERAKK